MNSPATPIHILLIEDDEVDIQSVLREFKSLESSIAFYIAKNGIEAFDMLYGQHGEKKLDPIPKAILLDTNMPKMGGIEFLTRLRADSKFDGIHVFMLTREYSTREKLDTHNLSVTQRIVKPIQQEDVLEIFWILQGRPVKK